MDDDIRPSLPTTHDAIIRSLIETIRDTAVVMFAETTTTTTAAVASSSTLMKIYRNLAQTFDLVIRFIREYRGHLLNSEVFEHRRRHLHVVARGRRIVDDDDHSTSHDHASSSSREYSLMARCTVVAMEYARDLTAQVVRSTIVVRKRRSSSSLSAPPPLSPSNDDQRRSIASFFTYAHKKIVTQAIRLIAQRTLEHAAIMSPKDCEDNLTEMPDPPSLTCYVCSRTFGKTFHYLQHIRVHYRLNLYMCAHCGKSFVQQNGLNYHVIHCCAAAARNRSDTVAAAAVSSLSTSSSLPEERRGCGNDDQYYELCNSCGRFFRSGQQLRNHVLIKHALRNADLGINRTQQEYIRKILRDM